MNRSYAVWETKPQDVEATDLPPLPLPCWGLGWKVGSGERAYPLPAPTFLASSPFPALPEQPISAAALEGGGSGVSPWDRRTSKGEEKKKKTEKERGRKEKGGEKVPAVKVKLAFYGASLTKASLEKQ